MRKIEGSNPKNESHLDFVEAPVSDFQIAHDFYAATVRMLWDGFESPQSIEDHISNVKPIQFDKKALKKELAMALKSTPIDDMPTLVKPTAIVCLQDSWNAKVFVWQDSGHWRMFSWGTSA